MKKYLVVQIVFSIIMASGLTGCTRNDSLTIIQGVKAVYTCENGDKITARYFSLSDKSLNFAKITMPDGKIDTLPQIISASGARYSAEMDLVWWIKGDTAKVEMRNEEGEWETKYEKCVIEEK